MSFEKIERRLKYSGCLVEVSEIADLLLDVARAAEVVAYDENYHALMQLREALTALKEHCEEPK